MYCSCLGLLVVFFYFLNALLYYCQNVSSKAGSGSLMVSCIFLLADGSQLVFVIASPLILYLFSSVLLKYRMR